MKQYATFEFVLRFRALDFEPGMAAFEEQLEVRLKHAATGHRISRLVGDREEHPAGDGNLEPTPHERIQP